MSRLRKSAWGFGVLLAAGATLLQPIYGQTQAINGSIRGRVTDASNAPVPQATVTVVNDQTQFSRSDVTTSDGYYVFPQLPLGTYTMTIKKEGFDMQRRPGIELTAGAEAVIDAQLKVGSVTTEVEVTGGAPIVEPSRINIGRTIEHSEVDNLPLTSRNPYNFIIFQPGVSGHPNPELGIPRTLNTNGLLDRINYQMDGMVDTESDRYGLRLFPISDVYVREVQTVSNSFAPEFGGTAGDVFNVVTNSGTNTPHGEFYYIGRPIALSARPILLNLSQPKPNLELSDFAGNAGGPIIKDKLFVFGGYEHVSRGTPSPITISSANATQLGLSSSNLATPQSVEHATFLNVRADWIINTKNQVFFRYNYFRNEFPFNTTVGGLNALEAESDFHDRAHVVGAQLLTTISSDTLNELRIGWPYRNEKHVAGSATGPGPQISITGVANFNGSISTGDRFQEKIPNLNDAVTLIRGRHTIKFGVGAQQIQDTQTADTYSQYVFSSIANYLAAKSGTNPLAYSQYNTVIGLPGAWYHSVFWNWFAQDSFQARPNLLITYGVRYDRFQGPDANPNAPFIYSQHFRTPGKNFAPRVGLAWSVTPSTIVRASTGIFFDPSPTNLWYNTFINSALPGAFTASILPNSPLAPSFPTVLTLQGGAVPPSSDITTVTPNYRNAYTINTSFQIEQKLASKDALTVGYVNTGGRELEFFRNLNLINPIGTLADGRPIFSSAVNASTRLFPQFGNITMQDVGAISEYNALIVNYQHRLSQSVSLNASYTWSHSISDAPDVNGFEPTFFIEDTTSRGRDRGNASVNRPDAFTLSAVLAPHTKDHCGLWHRLANDNQLTLLANISSGDQQNITATKNLNGDAKATSATRPVFIGRNTLRGANVYQIDARYTRTFFTLWERLKPSFIAEANNVFNVKNITVLNAAVPVDANGVAQMPSVFQPSSTVLEGRILQFGVRLDW